MEYECVVCGLRHPISEVRYFCNCGGALDIRYALKKIKLSMQKLRKRPFSHWRYAELYPAKPLISLQEGGTRLFHAHNLSAHFGLKNLFVKEEISNPTGSFKDRGSTVEVSRALEKNAKEVCVASTGNMGASCSAYAAVANLPAHVFVPKDISHSVRVQIGVYGSKLVEVEGNYDECARLARIASKKYGSYLLGDYVFRKEGQKSVAFEILDQLNFSPPDYILCPIGNGTLISALWKGICEFYELGLIRKKPRLLGFQAEGASPVYKVFREGRFFPEKPNTIAHAIAVGNPTEWFSAMSAAKKSGGDILRVSDEKMLAAQKLLAKKEGFFVQPGAAITIAGAEELASQNFFRSTDKIVCIVTGHGLKRVEPVHVRASMVIKPREAELERVFKNWENNARA